MILKRNHTGHRCGECHQKAKLSDEQVAQIRRMYRPGIVSYRDIAETMNCGTSTVRDIIKYKTRAL